MSQRNNFDFIRFLAASGVMLSHSFPYTTGSYLAEPFWAASNRSMTLGDMSVAVFFVVSGYLISMSLERSRSLWHYFSARALRIFPALIVVTLAGAFVLGPTLSIAQDYWRSPETWSFTWRNFTLFDYQAHLPGVFSHNNIPNNLNGSVWTLQYEVLCYVGLAVLTLLRLRDKNVVLALALLLCLQYALFREIRHNHVLDLARYFLVGSAFFLWRDSIKFNQRLALVCLLVVVVAIPLEVVRLLFPLMAYSVLTLAMNDRFSDFGRFGDFSYGIYLWGCPIQQLCSLAYPDGRWYENFLMSFPVVVLLGVASWYLVEKPALSLKARSPKRKNLSSEPASA